MRRMGSLNQVVEHFANAATYRPGRAAWKQTHVVDHVGHKPPVGRFLGELGHRQDDAEFVLADVAAAAKELFVELSAVANHIDNCLDAQLLKRGMRQRQHVGELNDLQSQ